jgi:hypothetical protein
LKWRPDFGASFSSSFLGYLLAASSDGNAYIFSVNDSLFEKSDLIKSDDDTIKGTIDEINLYESKKSIILKQRFTFGQCTSADWSQLNGATQIAVGYANGTISIYHLNSNSLKNQFLNTDLLNSDESKEILIYPVRSFCAHFTFVKCLKWSKINSDILASGSLFSREIKVWDLKNVNALDRHVLDYEVFVTDFDFSLHSNDLLLCKETSLKGENHMVALDLSFNIFNIEKDESRAHSSLFYSNSTMSSIDQSDYFNKFLVCDTEGNVILSRSSDTRYWIQKHKLMDLSYAVD